MQKYFEPFKDLQITTPLIETMIFQVHQRHLFHRNQTIHIIKGGIKGFRLTPLCSPPPFKLAQSDRGQKKKKKIVQLIHLASSLTLCPSLSHLLSFQKHPIKHSPFKSHSLPSKQNSPFICEKI